MSGAILLFPIYAFMAWTATDVLGFTVNQFYRSNDLRACPADLPDTIFAFFPEDRKLCSCRNVVLYCKTYLMNNAHDNEINSYFISISFKVCSLFTKPVCLVFTKSFAGGFARFCVHCCKTATKFVSNVVTYVFLFHEY
jgi:hypothetical protein